MRRGREGREGRKRERKERHSTAHSKCRHSDVALACVHEHEARTRQVNGRH